MGVIANLRRSALGAGGVALLLPVGLALGVALTTALGGSYQLHALLQVFNGPSVPHSRGRPTAPGLEAARGVPDVPPIPRPHRATGDIPSHSGTVRRPSAKGPAGPRPTRPQRRPSARPQAPPPSSPPAQGGPDAGGQGTGTPPPPPQSTPVHDAAQGVADAAKQLPEPVGATAGGAVQTVVDLLP